MSSSAHALEQDIHFSTPDCGYHDQIAIPLREWVLAADGTVLTGATAPPLLVEANAVTINWALSSTVKLAWQFEMPDNYAVVSSFPGRAATAVDTAAVLDDDIKVFVTARRRHTANSLEADANNSKILEVDVKWFTPPGNGAAVTTNNSLTTPARITLPDKTLPAATTNVGNNNNYSTLTFDIGARLRAEGKRILPGDIVTLSLGPSTNGSAATTIQVAATQLQYRRHIGLRDLRQRGILL